MVLSWVLQDGSEVDAISHSRVAPLFVACSLIGLDANGDCSSEVWFDGATYEMLLDFTAGASCNNVTGNVTVPYTLVGIPC